MHTGFIRVQFNVSSDILNEFIHQFISLSEIGGSDFGVKCRILASIVWRTVTIRFHFLCVCKTFNDIPNNHLLPHL